MNRAAYFSLAIVVGLGGCGGGGSGSAPVVTAPTPIATPAPMPVPPPAYVPPPNTINFTATSLASWRAARAAILSNSARAAIACVGDSTTTGLGSSSSLFSYATLDAYPTALATYLSAAKIPAHANAFFGDGGLFEQIYAADDRLREMAINHRDWISASETKTVGGYPLSNNASTQALVFTPASAVDTADVYDITLPAGTAFTVDVGNNATLLTVPSSNGLAPAVRKSTAHFALGKHAINIALTQAGATLSGAKLIGVDAYDSTTKDAAVWNMGFSNSQTSDWIGTGKPTDPLAVLAQLAPKLTLIDLGINDLGQRVSPETYRANLTMIIEAALKSGDVILIVPNRINSFTATEADQDAYAQVIRDLSAQYGMPVYDAGKALGSFQAATAAGYMFDDVHPSATGYAAIATGLRNMLVAN